MGHSHTHSAAGKNKRRLIIVLALTSTYLIAEVVGGWLTQSLALLADAGHMLTDVAGIAPALIAIRDCGRSYHMEDWVGTTLIL
jgi:cobalt-zinc-cadmium efflux system protein